jgi:hypothetical protein
LDVSPKSEQNRPNPSHGPREVQSEAKKGVGAGIDKPHLQQGKREILLDEDGEGGKSQNEKGPKKKEVTQPGEKAS